MASTFTTVQFMDPPGGPGVTGAIKAGAGIAIAPDGTISTTAGGGVVKTITGTNGITTTGTTDVLVALNPPTIETIGGVRTVPGSGISIDSLGVIRSAAEYSIQPGVGISVTNVTPGGSTVSVVAAGRTALARGGVWLDNDSGLSVSTSGALSLAPATSTVLGGIKVGAGLAITGDGILRTTGGTGTITAVVAGEGLTGGGTSGSVTLSIAPASVGFLGGVKEGAGTTIAADGTISVTPVIPNFGQVLTAGNTAAKSFTILGYAPNVNDTLEVTNSAIILRTSSNETLDLRGNSIRVGNSILELSTSNIAEPFIRAIPDAATLKLGAGTQIKFTDKFGVVNWGTINSLGLNIPTSLTVAGVKYPTADGTAGQVITTDGLGNLTFGSGTTGTLQQVVTNGNTTTSDIRFLGTPALPLNRMQLSNFGIFLQQTGVADPVSIEAQLPAITLSDKLQMTFNGGVPAIGLRVSDLELTIKSGTGTRFTNFDRSTTWATLDSAGLNVPSSLTVKGLRYPTVDGTVGQVLTTDGAGGLSFTSVTVTGFLPLTGGSMSGNISFAGTQTFPGVVPNSTFTGLGALLVGVGPATYTSLPIGTAGQLLTVSGGTAAWSSAAAAGVLPLTGGTMSGDITFSGTQSFPGTLPLLGGTMSGTIVFAGAQTFPGAVPTSAFTTSGDLLVGSGASTYTSLPKGSDGQVLTVSGGQVTWGTLVASGSLPLSGGTMTGAITFAAGQTISGYIADSLLTNTGDIVYASAANTPARLGLGAVGTILAVNGGSPAWRTSTQLGLLTSATAATTYAPLDSPTFTGPVTMNSGGGAGSNALTISGGNLVLSTSFTPATSGSAGSTGEIAWGGGYLYFCYAPNTWGRVQIDLTPF